VSDNGTLFESPVVSKAVTPRTYPATPVKPFAVPNTPPTGASVWLELEEEPPTAGS